VTYLKEPPPGARRPRKSRFLDIDAPLSVHRATPNPTSSQVPSESNACSDSVVPCWYVGFMFDNVTFGGSVDRLEQHLVESMTLISQVTAGMLPVIRALDVAQVMSLDGARGMDEWLASRLDVGVKTARTMLALARACDDRIDSALKTGASVDRAVATLSLIQNGADEATVEASGGVRHCRGPATSGPSPSPHPGARVGWFRRPVSAYPAVAGRQPLETVGSTVRDRRSDRRKGNPYGGRCPTGQS
jgi:hypothetical protein